MDEISFLSIKISLFAYLRAKKVFGSSYSWDSLRIYGVYLVKGILSSHFEFSTQHIHNFSRENLSTYNSVKIGNFYKILKALQQVPVKPECAIENAAGRIAILKP
jgi:hypothetical protein